jgi:parvulin-like peptidyl-prolyl isomerase
MWFLMAASPMGVMAQAPPEQTEPLQPEQQNIAPPRQATDVVVTVNSDPITEREVQANLQRQLQGQEVDSQKALQVRQQVVNTLVDSRLVEQYVVDNGSGVDPQEVDEVVERIESQVKAQQITMPQYLATSGQTEESFKKRVEGSLAWRKYQEEQLTDENLTRFFQQNRDRFQAETLDQVRQEVTTAYLGELWTSIIGQMKPEAEIKQPVPTQAPPLQGTPPLSPR